MNVRHAEEQVIEARSHLDEGDFFAAREEFFGARLFR